jgi:hypothetical protein
VKKHHTICHARAKEALLGRIDNKEQSVRKVGSIFIEPDPFDEWLTKVSKLRFFHLAAEHGCLHENVKALAVMLVLFKRCCQNMGAWKF